MDTVEYRLILNQPFYFYSNYKISMGQTQGQVKEIEIVK